MDSHITEVSSVKTLERETSTLGDLRCRPSQDGHGVLDPDSGFQQRLDLQGGTMDTNARG